MLRYTDYNNISRAITQKKKKKNLKKIQIFYFIFLFLFISFLQIHLTKICESNFSDFLQVFILVRYV